MVFSVKACYVFPPHVVDGPFASFSKCPVAVPSDSVATSSPPSLNAAVRPILLGFSNCSFNVCRIPSVLQNLF